jgi:hypothetical protein
VFLSEHGLIDWNKVTIPKGIQVIDRRGSAAGIAPGQGAVIAGNVFDMATGKPLANALITIDAGKAGGKRDAVAWVHADAGGRFVMKGVAAGNYRIAASAKGYAPLVIGYESVVPDSYHPFDDVELSPLTSMSGTVVDEAGKPVAGAQVVPSSVMGINGFGYRLPEEVQATTDAQGHFELAGLPRGFARVQCRATGLYAPMGDLHQTPDKTISIRMVATGTVKGKVVDANGRAVFAYVTLSVEADGEHVGKWGASLQTQPDGTFEIKEVPAGNYYISAQRKTEPGTKVEAAKSVTVEGGKTETVKVSVK